MTGRTRVNSTLVLALNPSIDAEWRVDDLLWEEKNDVRSERRWAGGKGINVARWLKHLGGRPQLLVPLGGKPGAELAGYLRAEKIPATAEGCQCFARPPRAKPRNTVGAGDALLAAVADQIQRDAPPREWLRRGLATGTAATRLRPGQLPGRH